MKTSITTRTAALLAAILVTFGGVDLMANYARPANESVSLASADRIGRLAETARLR